MNGNSGSVIITDHRLSALHVPGPVSTAVSMPFWDATQQGRLSIPRCGDCRAYFFYPRELCPYCWSQNWSWRDVSGAAALKTYTVVHRPGHFGWAPVTPYAIGLVELAEGPTLLTHVLAAEDQLRVGLELQVKLIKVGEWVLPCFAATNTLTQPGEKS